MAARSLRISQVLPTLNLLRPVKFGALLRNKFCVDATEPVGHAAQKMAQERLTFVMVCEPASSTTEPPHVLGMMTERDFMRYMTYASQHTFFSGQHPLDKRVSQVMTPLGRTTQLHPNTSVAAALRSIQHRIWRHLPVVDGPPGKEVLSSIVSIRDLILVADGGRTEDALPDALGRSSPTTLHSVWAGKTAGDVLLTKHERLQEKTLRSWLLAHSHKHTIGEHASVLAAAKQMEKEHLTFLVVVRDHEGIPEDVSMPSAKSALLAPVCSPLPSPCRIRLPDAPRRRRVGFHGERCRRAGHREVLPQLLHPPLLRARRHGLYSRVIR